MQHQVAQVQIAVALAHPARRKPLSEAGFQPVKLPLGPSLQPPNHRLQPDVHLSRTEQGAEIGQHRRPHRSRTTEARPG